MHRLDAFLDGAVVLLDHIVQVFDPGYLDPVGAAKALQHPVDRIDPAALASMRSVTIFRGSPFTAKARAKTS